MATAAWLSILLVACFCWKEVWNIKSEYNLCDKVPGHLPPSDHFPSVGDAAAVYIDWPNTSVRAVYHCLMKFTTCSHCRFRVEATSDFAFPRCYWWNIYNHYTGSCAPGCTYLHMFDPDYKNETGHSYSQTPWPQKFQTESSKLFIVMCSNHSAVKHVKLQVKLTVMEKKMSIRGSAYDSPADRYLHSPFFPESYAENDEVYVFEWTAMNHDDFIRLTFDDWLMSPQSVLWFEYANIKGPVYGSSTRPVVYSDGNQLRMRFRTGLPSTSDNRQYMGFKVTYRFFNQELYRRKTITGCGKYDLTSEGGTVKFEPTANPKDYYDCVWVLKRQPHYDYINVKLISFKGSLVYYHGQIDTLEIRESLTSLGRRRAAVTPGNADEIKTYSFDDSEGFYIRLKGRYSNSEDFVLSYTSFKYGNCRHNQYQCQNTKCIPYILKCDGYDHCGDNSDENSQACGRKTGSDVTSYTISIGVIIPMVVSIFLIVVICLLIIFIRRCRRLAQQNRQQLANGNISSVSGRTERGNRHRNRNRIRMNLTIQQDSPPAYDEVIRNTPIGYLNMAFMWSPPDDGMISPPSYEEATSSTVADLPRLTTTRLTPTSRPHGTSLSSSSSLESSERRSRILPPSSDSSTDGSQTSHTRAGSCSSSSDSTGNEQSSYHGNGGTVVGGGGVVESSDGQRRPDGQNRGHKAVDDSFIVPVSSAALENKSENRSASENQLNESAVENRLTSSAEPENGAASSPLTSRGGVSQVGDPELEDETRASGQDPGLIMQSSATSQILQSCTDSTDLSRSSDGGSSPSCRVHVDSSRSNVGGSSPSHRDHVDSSRSNVGGSSPSHRDHVDSSRSNVESSPSHRDHVDSSRSNVESSPSHRDHVDSSRSSNNESSLSQRDYTDLSTSASNRHHTDSSSSGIGERSPIQNSELPKSDTGHMSTSNRDQNASSSSVTGESSSSHADRVELSHSNTNQKPYLEMDADVDMSRQPVSPTSTHRVNSLQAVDTVNCTKADGANSHQSLDINSSQKDRFHSTKCVGAGSVGEGQDSKSCLNSLSCGEKVPTNHNQMTPNETQEEVTPLRSQEQVTPKPQEKVTPSRMNPPDRLERRRVLTREMLLSFPSNNDHDTFV